MSRATTRTVGTHTDALSSRDFVLHDRKEYFPIENPETKARTKRMFGIVCIIGAIFMVNSSNRDGKSSVGFCFNLDQYLFDLIVGETEHFAFL